LSAVRYTVQHETLYSYGREVVHSHQLLHLTPRNSERQACLEHGLLIEPAPAVQSEHLDAFGNRVTRIEFDRPHRRLRVRADMVVSVEAPPALSPQDGERWERVRDQLAYLATDRAAPWLEAMRFRSESPFVHIKRLFGDFARDCLAPDSTVLQVADCLMTKVHQDFTYAPGATQIATPLLEVFRQRRGVCQDYAHMMIACLRSAGLAARYVSGYLRTYNGSLDDKPLPPPPAEPATEAAEGLVGADASHAWVAVFAPPFGWVEFDPTNNIRVGQDHVALAWGRDFGDVSPLRGVILGGGSHTLSVRVAVQPH
jgi:transglutaminase-like putative cysteine protease